MCDGGCGGCSEPRSGFQPCVCINDLSRSAQTYLKIIPTVAGLSDAGSIARTRFDNMATLGVKHCIKFDPCCTSQISVPSAQGLVDFLNNTNFSDTANTNAQKFLKGDYTCGGQVCCAP